MKLFVAIIIAICLNIQSKAQSQDIVFDQALADSLGADDYGMKSYVLVILKTGPTKIEDKAVTDSLFRGHMSTINKLAKEGKLVVAGPLQKNDKSYRGIFILNVKTIEEARDLLIEDPAINAKIFDPEIFQWYGSAALPAYLKTHNKIQKKKIIIESFYCESFPLIQPYSFLLSVLLSVHFLILVCCLQYQLFYL